MPPREEEVEEEEEEEVEVEKCTFIACYHKQLQTLDKFYEKTTTKECNIHYRIFADKT